MKQNGSRVPRDPGALFGGGGGEPRGRRARKCMGGKWHEWGET